MHIRKLIFAAALCLGAMAFAPMAMADPVPDICVLDLSQPVTIGNALDTAALTCAALEVQEVASAVPIGSGEEGVAAGTCSILSPTIFTPRGHRQHEDPGRCLI